MKVSIEQKHLSINQTLARQINKMSGDFNNRDYSRIENINESLLKRDVSVEKKKNILLKKLHSAIVGAFSIDHSKFNKKSLESLKKRLHNVRKIIIQLRSINYHLETTFLEDLRLPKTKISDSSKPKQQNALASDELEALEYTTYKLIGEVVVLDKKLLNQYSYKGEKILKKERVDIKDLDIILRKESELLEHLEAKLPPPRLVGIELIKEPIFTNWVARVFALLSCLEHIYAKDIMIFSKLKKNTMLRNKIAQKIAHLIREKSKLIRIMEEKSVSIEKFALSNDLKKELHDFKTIINL